MQQNIEMRINQIFLREIEYDETDDIKVWLFGDTRSGKLVLERFADMEYPTVVPDYQFFSERLQARKGLYGISNSSDKLG